ncbi:MAG: BTAD domain-containing putative transcriptional regulator [Acidimicrobiales bacterium]
MPNKRWRGYLDAAVLFACEALLFVFFLRSRPWLGSVDFRQLSRWLAETAPQEALTALFRWLGLVVSGWMLASTCAYGVALLSGKRLLLKGTRFVTLPVLRRVLDAAAAATVLAASFGGGGGSAWASALKPPAPVVRAIDLPAPAGRPVATQAVVSLARVSSTAIGRHFPHPGRAEHVLPVKAPMAERNDVPSEANGFAGLPQGTKVVVVKPGDCLSVIAERHLGDWRLDSEIEALNWGRPQPDGLALVDDHWIYPGWVLVMPKDAVGTIVVGEPRPVVGEQTAPLEAGTTAVPHTTSATVEVVTSGGGAARRASRSKRVALLGAPGTRPATATRGLSTTPEGGGLVASSRPVEVGPNVRPGAAESQRPRGDPGLAAAVGLGALAAAGVVWRLDRSRRERLHARRSGEPIAPNRPEVEGAERRARAISRTEAAEWVDLGVRYLSGLVEQLRKEGSDAPSVCMVFAGQAGLEVRLAAPVTSSLGWFRLSAGGEALVLDPEVEIEDLKVLAGEHWPAWPALVSLGETQKGAVLLNLEHAGSLCVDGDAACVESALVGIALQLASQPWSDEMLAGLYVVGDCPLDGRLAQVERVAATAAEDLATKLQGVSRSHRQVFCEGSLGGLRAVTCEALPNVVVAFAGVPARARQVLVEAAVPDSSGVSVVAAGVCEGARWRLNLTGGNEGLLQGEIGAQSVCLALRLDCDRKEVVLLSEAVGAMAGQDVGQSDEDGEDSDGITEVAGARTNGDKHGPLKLAPRIERGLVEISILGPVDLTGGNMGALELSRRVPALAAIAYIASHDRPVTADELGSALWPLDLNKEDLGGPQRKTIMNVISRARALLGYGPGGQERLAYTPQGYRLTPDVTCDWTRFRCLSRLALSQGAAEARACLHQALELVRGEPFSGVLSSHFFEWVSSELIDLTISAKVADTAEQLGRMALDASDYEEAIWAADKGLQLDPAREELFRTWMHALGRSGQPGGVDKMYQRLRLVLRRKLHPLCEPQAQSRAVWRLYTTGDMAEP